VSDAKVGPGKPAEVNAKMMYVDFSGHLQRAQIDNQE
jgi:hypothetical protein